jgi:hypothetical protein
MKWHKKSCLIHIVCIVCSSALYSYNIQYDRQQEKWEPYVIQLYIRVSVVLSQSLCRKEREKLDINLDSAVFVFRVKEI